MNEKESNIWRDGYHAGFNAGIEDSQKFFTSYMKEINDLKEENKALRQVIVKLTKEEPKDGSVH